MQGEGEGDGALSHRIYGSVDRGTTGSTSHKTTFDFGEWRSDVASRKNPDGTLSFLTTVPGALGFEFVVGSGEKRTLIVRDAQHEYVFAEAT